MKTDSQTAMDEFAKQLSLQLALRERQWSAITSLLRVSELVPKTMPELTAESEYGFRFLADKIGVLAWVSPAIEKLAALQTQKMIEDAHRLALAGAIVFAHSVFEDLLNSAADLSFRANQSWWRKIIVANSKTKFTLKNIEDKNLQEMIASEGPLFLKEWKSQPLLKKVDSFFSVHPPSKSGYGEDIIFQRGSLQSLDSIRHRIVHEDVMTTPDNEIVDVIFQSFNSGRFVLRLIAEDKWIGFDAETLLKSASIMSGISNERIFEASSEITPEIVSKALDNKKPEETVEN